MNEREESEAEALKRFEHDCANTKLVNEPNELLSTVQKRIRDQAKDRRAQ
jgi:hypothetical protein